jgi:hypothetical protein
LAFTGLPHAPTWPRNLALALAVAILAAGAWSSTRRTHAAAPQRADLEGRRERLFTELATLERQRQAAGSDGNRAASTERRRALISDLESVYAALDS